MCVCASFVLPFLLEKTSNKGKQQTANASPEALLLVIFLQILNSDGILCVHLHLYTTHTCTHNSISCVNGIHIDHIMYLWPLGPLVRCIVWCESCLSHSMAKRVTQQKKYSCRCMKRKFDSTKQPFMCRNCLFFVFYFYFLSTACFPMITFNFRNEEKQKTTINIYFTSCVTFVCLWHFDSIEFFHLFLFQNLLLIYLCTFFLFRFTSRTQ